MANMKPDRHHFPRAVHLSVWNTPPEGQWLDALTLRARSFVREDVAAPSFEIELGSRRQERETSLGKFEALLAHQ